LLPHLALRGDLDEIYALHDVEAEFGLRIDPTTAGSWHTVGDLLEVLLLALPREAAEDGATWDRFRRALCRESGDDPEEVGRGTLLIRPRRSLLTWLRRLISR
jgi:hypothetical protein